MKRPIHILIATGLAIPSLYLQAESGDYSAMMQDLNSIRQRENISALVVLIADNEQTRASQAFGKPSHDSKDPLTLHHYIRIGSVSKMFTGLALLQLQNRHKVLVLVSHQELGL